MVIGIIFVFSGCATLAMSSVMFDQSSDPFFEDATDGFSTMATVMGVGTILVGAVLLLLSWKVKGREEAQEDHQRDLVSAQFQTAQPAPERTVEVIKVRCRYCGSLNDTGASKCVSCGATL